MAIYIGRRKFIALLGTAVSWPLAARGQQTQQVRRTRQLLPAAADDLDFQTRVAAFH